MGVTERIDRINRRSRKISLALVILIALGVGYYVYSRNASTVTVPVANSTAAGNQPDKAPDKANVPATRPPTGPVAGSFMRGGKFEASGVVQVPGTDYLMIVDDDLEGEVLLMQLDASGNQVGGIRPLSLGTIIENPEAITYDGTHYYVVGSQASPKKGALNAIARFDFDAGTQSIRNVQVIPNFRQFLISRVVELRGQGELKGEDGGLNIEAIAWDPAQQRLMLGLRSPIPVGNAMIVPMKLRDPAGPFSADNLQPERPIRLALGGQGIRDLHYDSKLKSFLIISGAAENQRKGDFFLWQWDGNSSPTQFSQNALLDRWMKPEGIAQVKLGDRELIFIVGDESRYLSMDYPTAR